MHFFVHQDGKTVYGLPPATIALGAQGDGTVYVLKVESSEVLYKGTYVVQRNSQITDLAELILTSTKDTSTDFVALVIIIAPLGAVEHVVRGSPTPVLRILRENDGDAAVAIVLEMTAGQRIEIVTRTNSPEVIDFGSDLFNKMRASAVR